ncbi:MAG: hypothetical protein ACRD26_23275 [Vicinamibacterales bacterium]
MMSFKRKTGGFGNPANFTMAITSATEGSIFSLATRIPEIGALPVRQFKWNVVRESCRHWLHAYTHVAAPANRPGDAVDRHGTIPEACYTYREMCVDGSAVTRHDIPQPSVSIHTQCFSPSSQIESDDHGRKSAYAGEPGANCIQKLNLLINRQVHVRAASPARLGREAYSAAS